MKAVGITVLAAVGLVFLGAVPAKPPATAPAEGPKNGQGLTASIVAAKDTYVLDPAQSGKAFRDSLEPLKNARGGISEVKAPAPPAVDLAFHIVNNSDKDVIIRVGGDDSQMQLKLEGPGAVTVENNVAMTMEFRTGAAVQIGAGKSYDVKISSLGFGMRGVAQAAYWTEPGEYTLKGTLVFGLGDRQGTVESAPVKLKVETAKEKE